MILEDTSKATFGKTVQEYKELKRLKKKNQNLRDHLTDGELRFNMQGEKATTTYPQEPSFYVVTAKTPNPNSFFAEIE